MREADLVPFTASRFAGGQRVLVLAPHPDDEVLGCGGALLQHVDAGDPVEVVFLTSGELGDWQGAGPDAIAARREEEARRSLALLGTAPPRFWRMPDRGLVADGALARRIHDTVRELGSTLVYAPSPLDLHPDHRATAHALRHALAAAGAAPEVALYETSHPLPPTHLVDVSAELDRKWAALACHGSQDSGAPPYLEAARGIGAYRALTLGPEVRAAEAYRRVPGAALGEDLCFRWAAMRAPPAGEPEPGPAISVIVRTVDRPALLRRALASLAQQTRRDFEVVLVNDGGPPLDALLAEFPELDIVPVVHAEARGRAAATNAGVRAARAALIAFLDDDDLYYPSHLEQLGRLLDEHPHLEGAYSDAEVVLWQIGGDGGRQLGYRGTLWSTDFDPERLLHENTIPNLCLMLRRSLWDRLGGVDESFDLYEDWELLIRLSREARLAHLPNVTAVYELRQDGSGSAQQGGARERDEETARARIEERYGGLRDPDLTERYAELARTSPRRRFEAADPWEPLPPAPPEAASATTEPPAPCAALVGVESRHPARLAVVIVHYRAGALAARAVASLLADARAAGLRDEELELVVVDNGSDADDELALDALPARVLRPGRNLGYAGGVNLGVARTHAERIVVANPDLVLRPGAIATLLAELDARGGIVGPRFAWDDAGRWMLPPLEPRGLAAETLRLLALRGGALASLARRRYRRHLMRFFRATAPLATTDLSGALLAFTREAWLRVGPMDEGYALYFEDAAWMESARRAGVPCRQLPGALAVHRFHSSAAREPHALGWFHASRARFRRAHHGELAARFLEWLELRLTRRAPPSPPAPSEHPPSLALPPSDARPAGLVAELSLEPLGIPATVAEVPADASERVAVPEECWEHAPPGAYRLSLLDGRGRELASTRATRGESDSAGARRSSVSAGVEDPVPVARLHDMISGDDDRRIVVELSAADATERAEALAARLGEGDVAYVVMPSRARFGLVPPPEEIDVRQGVAALCEAGLEIRSERALLGDDGAPVARLFTVRASGFRVRGYRDGDAAPVLDLFRRVFGVERSAAHLAWKYGTNPFGPGRISLAFAPDGGLAAHYAGYPQPYVHFPADGGAAGTVVGLQVGDTMTDPAHRDVGSGATKLLVRTTRHFFGTHRTGEIGFYFGFNRGGIQRFSARVIGGHIVEDVPFRSAPAAPLRDAGDASAIPVVDLRAGHGLERLDAFFRRVGPAHGFTARRDAAWLDWRYLRHPEQRYTVLATGGSVGLIGWAVFRREGDRLLMGDALLDPERAEEAARALVAAALERAGDGIDRVEGWFPPRPAFLDATLERIGFERTTHPDELSMLMLLEGIDSIELVRERLYYTLGDGDLF